MLETKTSTTWQVAAHCDVCKEGVARIDNIRAEYDALHQLRTEGWVFATIDVDHWRLKIAICPSCAPAYTWLRDIIDEHSPEARRGRNT